MAVLSKITWEKALIGGSLGLLFIILYALKKQKKLTKKRISDGSAPILKKQVSWDRASVDA